MIAIIPARGGSKGVVDKNIKKLCKKPLLAYTIESALKAKKVTRVIVSTDSEKIANIAIRYGAEVPFLRPKEISDDSSKILDNYKFAINFLKNLGENFNSFVALQPTSPFRDSDDINRAIDLFIKTKTDSVISFVEESHPIEWNRLINENKTFKEISTSAIYNRQIYKNTYRFNGAVYVFKNELVMKSKMYSENSIAYIMPKIRSLDIDTEDDFLYAEFLMRKLQNGKKEI